MTEKGYREVQLARVNVEAEGFADGAELKDFLSGTLVAVSADAYGEDGFRDIFWVSEPKLVTGSVSTAFLDGILYIQVPVGKGDWQPQARDAVAAGMEAASGKARAEGREVRWEFRAKDDVRPRP